MSTIHKIRAEFADLQPRVAAYTAVVASVALGVAGGLVVAHQSVGSWPGVVGLAGVAVLGERGRISLRGGFTVSISLLPTTFAAVLYGPLAAMVVFATSVAGQRIPLAGRVTYAGSRALTGAIAAGASAAAAAPFHHGTGAIVASSAAASLTAQALDALFASATYSLRRVGTFEEAIAEAFPIVISSVPLYTPVVAVLVLAYRDISAWTLPLFFVPAAAAHRWFLMYQEQRRLATDLGEANTRLKAANLSFARGLVATLDARDRYTAGHSAAVAIYARDVAARMGLSERDCDVVYLCGLVHDIGKIGLPAGLLEKPGALTLEERREMQRHCEIGERILSTVDTYEEIATVVRHHHERVDGQGYPDGLAGDEIPLLARIIAVADAYNAMTSDRPYRDAMPSRVARLRLAQAVETQFDTSVVAAFEAILAGASESYRAGIEGEFVLAGRGAEQRQPSALVRAALA
jgi:putative nucleotidyltransferase with HDIG domain